MRSIIEEFLSHCTPRDKVVRDVRVSLVVLTRQVSLYGRMRGCDDDVWQEEFLDCLLRANYRVKDGYVAMDPESVVIAFKRMPGRMR